MKKILIPGLLFFFLITCRQQDKSVLFFYHDQFYDHYRERKQSYQQVKKQFKKKSYQIREIELDSFHKLGDKALKILEVNPGSLIWTEPFCAPYFIYHQTDLSQNKLLTYDFDLKDQNITLPVFNIKMQNQVIFEKIIRFSKEKAGQDHLADVLLMTHQGFPLSVSFQEYLQQNKTGFQIYDNTDPDIEQFQNFIEEKQFKVLILFSYHNNSLIEFAESELLNEMAVLEILTHFGTNEDNITHQLTFDYQKMFIEAFKSSQLTDFLIDEQPTKINHYWIENENAVILEPSKIKEKFY